MGFFDRLSEGLSRSRSKFKEQMNVLLDRGPVSYTHLDVYKRQG